jgi:hypothetical protein
VPDELVGKNVKCPTCGSTFIATTEASPPPPEEEPGPPPRRSAPPPEEEDEDFEEERRPRRRRRRDYLEPHRGQLIMILGILSFFVAGLILGPIAWILGTNDLKAIRAGRMDPEGESQTNTGRICGMISTILHLCGIVLCCGIYMMIFAIGAANSNAFK